ncbi:hypothetical protein BHE74_00010571 [Ensete ventricosum]|nr:hypothetical protein BHE74_00010571 [Ensete ventricosum]RZR84021.1 hypothetical protein BHM03_00010759 [Ensete ventricosum]
MVPSPFQAVFLDLNEKDMKQIRILFREIYNDSAEAKIPAVLDYLSTVIEVSSVNIYYLLSNDTVDDIIWYVSSLSVSIISILGLPMVFADTSPVQGCCSKQIGNFEPGSA